MSHCRTITHSPLRRAWRERPAPPRRGGVTLLELVVALAILGAMAALVVPTLAFPERDPGVEAVVRGARSLAIHRAQALTLSIAADGAWRVEDPARADTASVAAGVLAGWRDGVVQLQLSPLGACVAVAPPPAALAGWDVAACRPAHPAGGGVTGAAP